MRFQGKRGFRPVFSPLLKLANQARTFVSCPEVSRCRECRRVTVFCDPGAKSQLNSHGRILMRRFIPKVRLYREYELANEAPIVFWRGRPSLNFSENMSLREALLALPAKTRSPASPCI